MQQKAADISCIAAWVFGVCSFTVTDVLQLVLLIVGVATGVFSLYFNVKRFKRERKE